MTGQSVWMSDNMCFYQITAFTWNFADILPFKSFKEHVTMPIFLFLSQSHNFTGIWLCFLQPVLLEKQENILKVVVVLILVFPLISHFQICEFMGCQMISPILLPVLLWGAGGGGSFMSKLINYEYSSWFFNFGRIRLSIRLSVRHV